MNIWLDDTRFAPEGWIHLHNITEVENFIKPIRHLKDFSIDTMSFDFNLGHEKKGIDVLKYLANLCISDNSARFWPKKILYHTNDPQGRKIMTDFVAGFEKEILTTLSKNNW